MHRCLFATVVAFFVAAACALPAFAERPLERREDATYAFTGTVRSVYVRETSRYRNYVIEIRIDKVERGEGFNPRDVFFATCFQRKKGAPPEPSASGHSRVPKEGQQIKAYVNRRRGKNEGVYADWFDVLPEK